MLISLTPLPVGRHPTSVPSTVRNWRGGLVIRRSEQTSGATDLVATPVSAAPPGDVNRRATLGRGRTERRCQAPRDSGKQPHKLTQRAERSNGPRSRLPQRPPTARCSPRHHRSEALQLAAPTSCPQTEDPHWRASAKLPLGQSLVRDVVCSDDPAESVAPRLTSGLVLLVEDPHPGFSTRSSTSHCLRSSGDRAPLS